MGELRTLGRRGDTTLSWDPANAAEVQTARTAFANLRGKSFLAFRVEPGERRGAQITEFDPDAARIVMVPPMAGG